MYWVEIGNDIDKIDFEISNRKYPCCNNIMCFDIETSSAYISEERKVTPFIQEGNVDSEMYKGLEKVSICYVWQFSIDNNVYMGRTLQDFRSLLVLLENFCPYEKIIYVHNLSFEFQFLLNILDFDYVFARKERKVLFAKWESYTFRCSYFLVNMSLEKWAEQKNLPIKKLVGNLDYSVLRTPKTELTKEEIEYCVNDVLVMYEGLKEYKEIYGNVKDIPLTQTGRVRKEVIKRMSHEYKYRKKCLALIPKNIEDYKELIEVFQGGYTHASYIHSGKVLSNVSSMDITSSYPYAMSVEKYPMTPFMPCKFNEKYMYNDKYSYIIHIVAYGVESKLYNSFLSKSKCRYVKNCKLDNGRIIKTDELEIKLTNIDYELFLQCYDCEKIDIIEFKVSVNGYLSPVYVKYILELFGDKTKLKNLEGYEDSYMSSKEFINSLYGMFVTKDITDEITFSEKEWGKKLLDNEIFIDRVEHIKKNQRKVFSAFQFGVWVTAYARRNLWNMIIKLDKYVVYVDTDSIKYLGNHDNLFIEYNKKVELKEQKIAKILNVSESLFHPLDKKGIEHRLGIYDFEGTYNRFKTLGAKKYIVEKIDKEGNTYLEMTVSGVRKSAVSQIKNIEEFDDNLVFDIEHAQKLIMHYNDNQSNCVWNYGKYDEFKSKYKYGISAQPTTYKLGITLEYYLLMLENMRGRTEIFCDENYYKD